VVLVDTVEPVSAGATEDGFSEWKKGTRLAAGCGAWLSSGLHIMFHFCRTTLAVFVALAFFPSVGNTEQIEVVPNQYIVQRGARSALSAQRSKDLSYTIHDSAETFDVVIPKRAGVLSLGASPRKEPIDWVKVAADCKEIQKDPSVSSCEPNVFKRSNRVPNDEWFILQWGLLDVRGNDADIRASVAWEKGTGSKSTLIGVIDSGIFALHPDLITNLWINPNEDADDVDNDGNGYVDDLFGVNTTFGTNNPIDCTGHGTHVSGIIGASGNNGAGVSGVNWTTSLIMASDEDGDCDGSTPISSTLKAYDYFYRLKRLGHNVRVVNASFGGAAFSAAEYNAISRLNSVDILVVASAGNANSNNDISPRYPANYELPNVISVGATGPRLRSTVYSNYGQTVDIAAPGGDLNYEAGGIVSTWSPRAPEGVTYNYIEGTSMAAPMVTGAIGLLASQRPYLTGAHLKNILYQSADSISALSPFVAGGRFLNLGAMAFAADPSDTCPANPNKLEPGICGCGKADSYRDSDNDATYDCVDQCPADATKTTPGVCGCGVADVDANANRVLDCKDPVVPKVVPPSPSVKAGKRSVTVTMSSKAGVSYYVKVKVQPKGKGKAKTSFIVSPTRVRKLSKLDAGSTVSVSYAYMVEGTPRIFSKYSGVKKVTVR
jgi:subtilisin family serine protease